MKERYRGSRPKLIAALGLASIALMAPADINQSYAQSPCSDKTQATYKDIVADGQDDIAPKIEAFCPPDTWKVTHKTIEPIISCWAGRCALTKYYRVTLTCVEK